MTEQVTIKATETTIKLAKEAVKIQNACNPLAITRFLERAIYYWTGMGNHEQLRKKALEDGQKYSGSDMAMQNPITVAIINKLCDLGFMEQSEPHGEVQTYIKCMELAEGKDVEVPIAFRN